MALSPHARILNDWEFPHPSGSIAQLVEHQILNLRVVGSSPTLGAHLALNLAKLDCIAFRRTALSISKCISCWNISPAAQSVEHQTLNLRVVGSSPTFGDHFAMKLGKIAAIVC